VLVGLYEVPEKPANAIDFIKEYLGAPVGVDVDKMKALIADQAKQIEDLQQQLRQPQ
jgi:predicted ATP-grasp superfamily ATP-dependent carboligase